MVVVLPALALLMATAASVLQATVGRVCVSERSGTAVISPGGAHRAQCATSAGAPALIGALSLAQLALGAALAS